MEKFKNWMIESANIMFDDSKNDLRSLPKSVRLQILIVYLLSGLQFSVSMYLVLLPLFGAGLEWS